MKQYLSIVVPVLNGEKHINHLLNSLIELNYPKDKYEIIIVDNGSNDGTVELIKNFQKNDQIRLFFEKRKSSYAARNTGIRNATGEIIVFIDADCIADKDWLNNIESYFCDKSIGGIAGEILSHNGSSLVERYLKTGILSQEITFNSKFLPYAQTANAAYRKELFSKIGYFDEVISGGDADYSWRVRLETDYKIIYAQNAIVFHRHRTDFKGLFKQRFKHGYGSVLIRYKYKNIFDSKKGISLKLNKSSNPKNRIVESIKTSLKNKEYMLILPILVNALGFNLGKAYAKLLLIYQKK